MELSVYDEDLGGICDIADSDDKLRHVAARLYDIDEADVEITGEAKDVDYDVKRVEISAKNGGKKAFFIKKSWEGVMKEALGIELYNVVSDDPTAYAVFSGNILVTDEVSGKEYGDLTPEELEDPELAYNFGIAESIGEFLDLDDRDGNNLIVDDTKRVKHIDFGFLFDGYCRDVEAPERDDKIREGKRDGERMIREKFGSHVDEINELSDELLRIGKDDIRIRITKASLRKHFSKYTGGYDESEDHSDNNGTFKETVVGMFRKILGYA